MNVALATDGSGTRILTGPGIGGGPVAVAFDLTGQRLFADFAFDSALRGGISVAAGDVTGDGFADYIIGAGPGGGPAVRVYDPAKQRWADGFFPFAESSSNGRQF